MLTCTAPLQQQNMHASRAATHLYQENTQCWFVGSTLSKSLHRDKNAQVYGAQQLQLCDETVQLHWSCNCTFKKRTSRHLSGKQCEWRLCLLLQSVREIEQWGMRKVVKYRVWWVVVSSQSALWGVKHGSGHWHCRSSFLQRKPTQRKQRTQKQLHKIKQEINSTQKANTRHRLPGTPTWCTPSKPDNFVLSQLPWRKAAER